MSADESDHALFHKFVEQRSAKLVRAAWLLTGNEAQAYDLVQTALLATWVRWARISHQAEPEAYVRRVMMSTFLTSRRRRWLLERPTAELPDGAISTDTEDQALARRNVIAALKRLPPRQRAVLVLRYYQDLTEAQVAEALGCSVGTVKSQSSKALAGLRVSPELREWWVQEVPQQ